MPCRRALLALLLSGGAVWAEDGFTSDVARQRSAEQARLRDEWWARERERQTERRVTREMERRRDLSGQQIRRWEDDRARRSWGQPVP